MGEKKTDMRWQMTWDTRQSIPRNQPLFAGLENLFKSIHFLHGSEGDSAGFVDQFCLTGFDPDPRVPQIWFMSAVESLL